MVLVAGLLAAGCGQDTSSLAPVRGRVYFKGEPLRGGVVVFVPDTARGGHGPPLAFAAIQSDGTYEVRTEGEAGVVPGWHRVTVTSSPEAEAAGQRLPPRYASPESSGLSHEVLTGQDNVIDLHLD